MEVVRCQNKNLAHRRDLLVGENLYASKPNTAKNIYIASNVKNKNNCHIGEGYR